MANTDGDWRFELCIPCATSDTADQSSALSHSLRLGLLVRCSEGSEPNRVHVILAALRSSSKSSLATLTSLDRDIDCDERVLLDARDCCWSAAQLRALPGVRFAPPLRNGDNDGDSGGGDSVGGVFANTPLASLESESSSTMPTRAADAAFVSLLRACGASRTQLEFFLLQMQCAVRRLNSYATHSGVRELGTDELIEPQWCGRSIDQVRRAAEAMASAR